MTWKTHHGKEASAAYAPERFSPERSPMVFLGSRRLLASLAAVCVLAGCASAPPPIATRQATPSVPAEVLNPDVTQASILQTVCVAGYTASVRPSMSFTNGVKQKLLRERGLPLSAAADYELDHVVPLALGGHPRALANLQLQAWEGERGAKAKDVIERLYQTRVCAGQMGLEEARRLMLYNEWGRPSQSVSVPAK